MHILQDISESAARRAFLLLSDDQRIVFQVEADEATFPDEAARGDIMGELYKDWQPLTGMTNADLGRLMINIGCELMRKPTLQHLDGEKPIV
jgi:hypothetical protein